MIIHRPIRGRFYTGQGTVLCPDKKQLSDGTNTLRFSYTADGIPRSVNYNGADYYYLYNLQGDVITVYSGNGTAVVNYAYDSWGKLISVTGSLASTLGALNPFRYRGYYYDTETGFYYLTTRYYDPEVCRFINADGYISTGQGFTGFNMFAYCLNNPAMYFDKFGHSSDSLLQTVYDVFVIMACIIAMESYITEDNIGAFSEYAERTTNENTTLSEFAQQLKKDIGYATDGENYSRFSLASVLSIVFDSFKLAGKFVPDGSGDVLSALSVLYDGWIAYHNPLKYDHEIGIEAVNSALGVLSGAALFAFSAELGAAITFGSGDPAIGSAAAIIFYVGMTLLIDYLDVF